MILQCIYNPRNFSLTVARSIGIFFAPQYVAELTRFITSVIFMCPSVNMHSYLWEPRSDPQITLPIRDITHLT